MPGGCVSTSKNTNYIYCCTKSYAKFFTQSIFSSISVIALRKFFSMNKLVLYCSLLLIMGFNACTPNNVVEDNSIKHFFDENKVNGTFAIFDNAQGIFNVYNLNRYKDSTYLPASTFKIINGLIGIETGKIINERMVIPWDGVTRRPEWDKDLTMAEAFKVSAVPYFQEIARRIGKDTMQHWIDSLGIGSRYNKFTITNNLDTFWLDNSMQVTPDEELGIVKKLYFNQLPFQGRTQDIVKKLMEQENNANYRLSYKTGLGTGKNGNTIGWVTGWIEENKHVYPFVLNIEGPQNADLSATRITILKGILKQYGFFEGKK